VTLTKTGLSALWTFGPLGVKSSSEYCSYGHNNKEMRIAPSNKTTAKKKLRYCRMAKQLEEPMFESNKLDATNYII
jgi:hypothetical protein